MNSSPSHTPERQAEIREQFKEADAISKLEGYEPDAFEEAQKARIVAGEITTEQFIQIMAEHVGAGTTA